MKSFLLLPLLALAMLGDTTTWGQVPVVPATPRGFDISGPRSSTGPNASILQPAAPKKIVKKYTAVSDSRIWKNTAGRTMTANLLAFDEGGAEGAKRPLTLIMAGNVRLLKAGSADPVVVPLQTLTAEDQAFIAAIDKANRQPAPTPAVPEKAP